MSGSFVSGIEAFGKKIDKLAENAQQLDGHHEIPLSELFPAEFMTQYTDHVSFDEMLKASPFKIESAEDFKAVPDAEWDAYVMRTTRFADWLEMQKTGAADWAKHRLGF